MRQATRTFLIDGGPAHAVLMKWQAVGVYCELDETGTGFDMINYSWPEPGTDQPPAGVPTEALDELGEYYDEILSHLRYWKETKDKIERIWAATDGTMIGSPESE